MTKNPCDSLRRMACDANTGYLEVAESARVLTQQLSGACSMSIWAEKKNHIFILHGLRDSVKAEESVVFGSIHSKPPLVLVRR